MVPIVKQNIVLLGKMWKIPAQNVSHVFRHSCKNRALFSLRRMSSLPSNSTKNIRNIGIIAHIDAGKTTTTERMLYYSGFTDIMGEVHDGDTIMDYMPQERERGITITSAAISFEWKKYKINLVDTPGHVDFTIEVERALCALDGAVIILDASAGVEVQTLTVWHQAKRYGIPCVAYLNKMDKPGANFDMSLKSLKDKLKVKPLVLQTPIGKGKSFHGVVDLTTMRKLTWNNVGENEDGSVFKSEEMKADDFSECAVLAGKQREELIEAVADFDDRFAEKLILSGQESLSHTDLISAIRRITLSRTAVPVLCGSSYKNIAVQPLMDSVVLYLPSPDERCSGIVCSDDRDMRALVFKIIHDKRRGPLTFLRLYSGNIECGQRVYNVTRQKSEKITNLMIPLADDFKDVHSLFAGNIGVVAGLKDAVTGDTLSSSSNSPPASLAKNMQGLEQSSTDSGTILQVPDPVFFCTIEPPSVGAQNKLEHALHCLEREDPTFRVEHDEEMGQTVISGMGELHIEVMKERIVREYGIQPYLGPLQVAYRESLSKEIIHEHILNKSLAGSKHFVKITMAVLPAESTEKFRGVKVIITKENELGKLRMDHQKAVNAGVVSALQHGPLLGFPVIGVAVSLLWLEVGRGTSLQMVTAAASQCIKETLNKSSLYLLEPLMKLCITSEKGYAGCILNDLSQRRSQILSMDAFGGMEVILSKTPLSELKNYSTHLRAMTSGRCSFTMEFDSYKPMDSMEQAKAVESVTGFAPS